MTEMKEVPDMVQELRDLRFNWSDKVTEERVNSASKDNKRKVRKAWFSHVIYACWLLSDAGKIATEDGRQAAKDLMERFSTEKFQKQKETKEDDIKEANRLIDVVLSGLKA